MQDRIVDGHTSDLSLGRFWARELWPDNSQNFATREALLIAAGNAAIVFFISAVAQWFIYEYLLKASGQMRWLSPSVAAVVTAVLSWKLKRSQERDRCLELQRLRVIAEVNHHIRNSLQILVYDRSVGRQVSDASVDAINRIDWTLKQVLPRLQSAADGSLGSVSPKTDS
jgi:hypothetical protein